MGIPRWFSRRRQSKGHGVHSPFAFGLITKVLRSSHGYYAFFDIPEMLRDCGVELGKVTSFNYLSFRLVHHFKAENILEINSGKGVNTLFLLAPSPQIHCTCVEKDPACLSAARSLHERLLFTPSPGFSPPRFMGSLPPSSHEKPYDAIFVNINEEAPPHVDTLWELGHENSFWVIHSIREKQGKQFWKKIVNDERINVTFDMKEIGIAFPWPSLTPADYLV